MGLMVMGSLQPLVHPPTEGGDGDGCIGNCGFALFCSDDDFFDASLCRVAHARDERAKQCAYADA